MIGKAHSQTKSPILYSLKLMGTSVSKRKSFTREEKLEGRMRQERVILHFGHLASIHIESLPFKKVAPKSYPYENFSITVITNPLLEDKSPLIIQRPDLSRLYPQLPLDQSLNKFAKRWQLFEFLMRQAGNSSLASHRYTVKRLTQIYQKIREKKLCFTY